MISLLNVISFEVPVYHFTLNVIFASCNKSQNEILKVQYKSKFLTMHDGPAFRFSFRQSVMEFRAKFYINIDKCDYIQVQPFFLTCQKFNQAGADLPSCLPVD